jgi:hypothetical protein
VLNTQIRSTRLHRDPHDPEAPTGATVVYAIISAFVGLAAIITVALAR